MSFTDSRILRWPKLFAMAGLIVGTPAYATERHVPAQYATIQAAVDASVNGDEVVLADGTYIGAGNKNLNLTGKQITLRSASGNPAACIIDCENSGKLVFVAGGSPSTAVSVLGLTLTHAVDGIQSFGGSLTISNCRFESNVAAVFGQEVSVTITHCAFIGNTGGYGGGVCLLAASSATIEDCTFEANAASSMGSGVYSAGATLRVTGCAFIGNSSQVSSNGGALAVVNVLKAVISQCSFLGNHSDGNGGAIYTSTSQAQIHNCIFSGNTAVGIGGAIRTVGSPNIVNCTLYGNSAGAGGGISAFNAAPRIVNCILWNNAPSQLAAESGASLQVSCSDIHGGYAGTGNLNVSPNFIDPNGDDNVIGTEDDNLRLAPLSPVIDKGHNVPFHFTAAAGGWLTLRPTAQGYAFDQFKPGIANGSGCVTNGDWAPTLPLEGGTVELMAVGGGIYYCPITDGSGTPAVSDGSLSAPVTTLQLTFDPPITAFHTYYGSLAAGTAATMQLFNGATQIAQFTSNPSDDNVLARGHGFSSLAPIDRIEITSTDTNSVVGAFVGLAAGEPSLGTVNIPGYSGPTGASVLKDFGVVFGSADLPGDLDDRLRVVDGNAVSGAIVDMGAYEFNPCPADLNGDGSVDVNDLLAVVTNWGATGTNPGDITGDDVVNVNDLLTVITNWGACP